MCKPGKLKEVEIDKRLERLEALNAYTNMPCNPAVLKSISQAEEFSTDYDILEAAIAYAVEQESSSCGGSLLDGWHGLEGTDLGSVGKLDGPGAILVFLPGAAEISKLQKQLQASSILRNALDGVEARILPLHGMLAPAQQQAVFRRYGSKCRKIVLSTNIAETYALPSEMSHRVPDPVSAIVQFSVSLLRCGLPVHKTQVSRSCKTAICKGVHNNRSMQVSHHR